MVAPASTIVFPAGCKHGGCRRPQSPAYCPVRGLPASLASLVFARPERNELTSAATRLARDGDPRDQDLQELHRRRVGGRRVGRHVREHESRRTARRSASFRSPGRKTSTARSRPRRTPSRAGGSFPAPKRGEILFRFAQLLTEHKAELTDLMSHEMGKVLAEAGGDVQEAIDMSYYMGGEGRRLFGQTTPSELPRQVQHERAHADRRRRRDHAVELPDRHPVLEDRARARRAGTRSSSSPRRTRPALGERFVELLAEAGIPAGVVNVVHGGGGDGRARGSSQHPDVPVITHDRVARDRRPGHAATRPRTSSTSISSWAGRTPSSSWTTPTSTWRRTGSSGRPSAPPASAARPRAA